VRTGKQRAGSQLAQAEELRRAAHSLHAMSVGVPVGQQVLEQEYQAHIGPWALQSPIDANALQSGHAVDSAVPLAQQVSEQ
jgi:hypothetical protein